ncbi:MAG: hypothetical protein ACYCU7_18490 [Acidimicrobiales bacterium]
MRDLAAAIEMRTPEARAGSALTVEGVDRLAGVLLAGSVPTIGF